MKRETLANIVLALSMGSLGVLFGTIRDNNKEINSILNSPYKKIIDVNKDGLVDYVYYDGTIATQLPTGRYFIEHNK